ncbi:MAG: hypothetical protein AAF533_17520 [Acidobacteriota bacterium]
MSELSRRHFQRLAAAALLGAVTGACKRPDSGPHAGGTQTAKADAGNLDIWLEDVHVCRGLNTCKGKGQGGENACAGQGTCASVAAHHCGGSNACRGQGGCGSYPGENTCQGQGACCVPLMEQAWPMARTRFEQAMKKAGREYGAAPAAS